MSYQAHWDRLKSMLDQIDRRGLKSLSHQELLELGRLYRRTASDLSFAQSHGLDPHVKRHLNHLIGRAYGKVYHVDSSRNFTLKSITTFLTYGFPNAVRRGWIYIAISTGFFVLASAIAMWATLYDESFARAILPLGMIEMLEMVIERHAAGGDWLPGVTRPLASSEIMTNNIMVSFMAFSLGITGLGTFYILGVNGLMVGSLSALAMGADPATASNLWGFIAPHGVIEIPAILLSGGAGLILGHSLINPGPYKRVMAIRVAAKQALPIVVGVILILVIAGLIEAFFSPTLTPDWIKFTFAGILFTSFIYYLFLMPIQKQPKA